MHFDEVQTMLDTMMIPRKKDNSNIKANKSLSDEEKNNLYNIVVDFETQNNMYDYMSAIEYISRIMLRYTEKAPNVSDSNSTKILLHPKSMPFLIKQVLFYIAVCCIAYELDTQANIISAIRGFGVPISHNFFSRMKMTPTNYYKMVTYRQPELQMSYMGQKHGSLGVAIKHLAYQSGKYDWYVDVFGGSMAASLAVERRKDCKYAYNEINRCVYNLAVVLSDEQLSAELQDELCLLQAELRGEEIWLDNIDFDKEMKKFYENNRNPDQKETDILANSTSEYDINISDIKIFMEKIKSNLAFMPDSWGVGFDGTLYTKQMLQDILNTGYISFFSHFKLIEQVANALVYPLSKLKVANADSRTANVSDFLLNQKQVRFYKYYAYFENLLNAAGEIASTDRVRYAVAQLYHSSFTTSGNAGVSSILRMIYSGKHQPVQNISKDADNFIDKDFRNIIGKITERFKNVECTRLDCIDVIDQYFKGSNKCCHPLFYVDSPYEGTSDYQDEINGVSPFTASKMKDLILKLKSSGGNFIFSCRAAKGAQPGSKTTEELRKGNREIYDNVFDVFRMEYTKKRRKLWVLAVETNGTLEELICKNRISEIMITNYEICSFHDSQYSNTTYTVYDFKDFLNLWEKNVNK